MIDSFWASPPIAMRLNIPRSARSILFNRPKSSTASRISGCLRVWIKCFQCVNPISNNISISSRPPHLCLRQPQCRIIPPPAKTLAIFFPVNHHPSPPERSLIRRIGMLAFSVRPFLPRPPPIPQISPKNPPNPSKSVPFCPILSHPPVR